MDVKESKKYRTVYLVLSFLILLFPSCGGGEKKEVRKEPRDLVIDETRQSERDTAGAVVITGKTDDTAAFKYFNLIRFSDFGFSPKSNPDKKTVTGDSLHLQVGNVQQPQLMDVMAFTDNKDSIPYFTRIFVTPGDSIFLQVKNGKMEFVGKQEAHYNFFLTMDDPLRQEWGIYRKDPFNYKKQLQESFDKKDSLLENYIRMHPEVSEDFMKLVSSELKFEYLYNLILPRNVRTRNGLYTNNANDIVYVNAISNPSASEMIFDPSSYFEGISISDFQRPDLINNDYFRRSLILYIRHYFSNQQYLEYSRRNFLTEKQYIQKHLEGELETYAIGRLINDYYQRGFGQGKKDRILLQDLIMEYEETFSDPSYAQRMNEILQDLAAFNFELPDEVLNEKLVDASGDTVTLRQILRASGDKIKVIDFWATWCPPCFVEFKRSHSFKRSIAKEEALDFLYFSIDKQQEQWRSRLQNLSEYIPMDKHYLILDTEQSPILKHMLIHRNAEKYHFSIPHYSILGTDNSILNNNAPRPSDSLIFRKVIEEIKEN